MFLSLIWSVLPQSPRVAWQQSRRRYDAYSATVSGRKSYVTLCADPGNVQCRSQLPQEPDIAPLSGMDCEICTQLAAKVRISSWDERRRSRHAGPSQATTTATATALESSKCYPACIANYASHRPRTAVAMHMRLSLAVAASVSSRSRRA